MRTVLQSLLQWGVVAGTVLPPSPVDADHLILDETKAKDALEVREVPLHGDLLLYSGLRQTRSGRHPKSQRCLVVAREAVWC